MNEKQREEFLKILQQTTPPVRQDQPHFYWTCPNCAMANLGYFREREFRHLGPPDFDDSGDLIEPNTVLLEPRYCLLCDAEIIIRVALD